MKPSDDIPFVLKLFDRMMNEIAITEATLHSKAEVKQLVDWLEARK